MYVKVLHLLDSQLVLKELVNKLCQLAYLEIRRTGSVRQHLSFEATNTLVSSLVLSRLHYCNALPAGSLQVLLDKVQRIIHCSARLIFKVPKSAHITPFIYDLHWLPISNWIQYKLALICFCIDSGTAPPYLSELLHLYSPSGTAPPYLSELLHLYSPSGTAPPYLSEMLHLYSPSRSLRSAADTRIFRVPGMGRRTLGARSFQDFGPVLWNSLPLSVRHSSSLSSFKSKLKTYLFSSAY